MHNRSQIAKAIAEKTLKVQDSKQLAHAVAGYLLEENRVYELDSIMRDVLAYRAQHGHVEVSVVSAFPISSDVRDDVMAAVVQEYPNAASYNVNETIDPNVVGGLRIEFGGEELDLTVRAKLNKFKQLTAARKD
ncbi:hypothetical protein EB118_01695 [bacterium]|nr:hypothetical protein [bacterium]NBX97955.1 hypothetical protein [bacterium]NDC94406.1 hypothetical protein [bacterium]NDD83792.1 hypothetical protein [bacterium]NDG28801.1 hypothetical protein [bacterium]